MKYQWKVQISILFWNQGLGVWTPRYVVFPLRQVEKRFHGWESNRQLLHFGFGYLSTIIQ